MKSQLKTLPQSDSCFILQFDRRLPQLFPNIQRAKGLSARKPPRHPLSYPPLWRQTHAKFLMRLNKGQVPFELESPAKTYLQVLDALSATEGLVEIADCDPYSIGFTVGGLFSPDQVAEQVAEIFHQAFYSDEPLEFLGNPASATASQGSDASDASPLDGTAQGLEGEPKRNEKEKW